MKYHALLGMAAVIASGMGPSLVLDGDEEGIQFITPDPWWLAQKDPERYPPRDTDYTGLDASAPTRRWVKENPKTSYGNRKARRTYLARIRSAAGRKAIAAEVAKRKAAEAEAECAA